MATITELEARIAALEAAAITPLALVPPITIGELTDVPAPGSQIAANWAQEVSARIIHRFANKAAIDAWSTAPNGARAVQLDSHVEWRRVTGGWSRVTPWTQTQAGTATPAGAATGTFTINTLAIPADLGPRSMVASCYVKVDRYTPNGTVAIRLLVNGGTVSQYDMAALKEQSPIGGGQTPDFASMVIAVPSIPTAAFNIDVQAIGTYINNEWSVPANPAYNRVDVCVMPRGN
jgi:hypothetical protein